MVRILNIMLITEIYNGQGLGNQIWCYTVTRTLAKDLGYKFGIQSPNKFKGLNLFPNIKEELETITVNGGSGPEGGPPTSLPENIKHYYKEKNVFHPKYNCYINPIDTNFFRLPDNTKIDGTMQAEQYIDHRREDIKKLLHVNEDYYESKYSNKDTCILNLRGGPEYIPQHDLFLQKNYWDNAIEKMRKINSNMKFVVITDDVNTSQEWFPDFEVRHETLEWDYSVIHNAYYTILSNTSFAWFAVWTSSKNKFCIAPKYWARHNISDGFWSQGEALTKDWLYQDTNNNFHDYGQCKVEYENFKHKFFEEHNIQL